MASVLPWPWLQLHKMHLQLNKDRKSQLRKRLDAEQKHGHKYCSGSAVKMSFWSPTDASVTAHCSTGTQAPAQGFTQIPSTRPFLRDNFFFFFKRVSIIALSFCSRVEKKLHRPFLPKKIRLLTWRLRQPLITCTDISPFWASQSIRT